MGRVKDEPLFQLLHDYLKKYLPDQKYASPNTVKAYRTALNQFFEYVVQEKSIPLSEITFPVLDYDMVNAYLDWLVSEKKCSPATRNHRLTCIRSFFAYAASRSTEYMAYQAALSKIPKQKAGKIPVEYMSEEAVQTILKQPDTSTRQGIRDQFFMVLLYDTSGSAVGGKDSTGAIVADQLILAPDPKDGQLGEITEGTWIYYIRPEDQNSLTLPDKVRAELYRTQDAQTNDKDRLVSDTKLISVPESLPEITITSQP